MTVKRSLVPLVFALSAVSTPAIAEVVVYGLGETMMEAAEAANKAALEGGAANGTCVAYTASAERCAKVAAGDGTKVWQCAAGFSKYKKSCGKHSKSDLENLMDNF